MSDRAVLEQIEIPDLIDSLARIGKQPRPDRGKAELEPFPEPPGTAPFNAATSTLSLPALPVHASFLRAFRKSASGAAELAGTSPPSLPARRDRPGHNFRGDGPESNHVTRAVPVEP